MTVRPAIPVSVVGGFLGAGKTTLLNRLLQENDGRRLGLIVNDFGDINIDEKLIVTRDEDMVSLANGCICCSIGNDFLRALISLVTRPAPPEHIIIEASGVADPLRIAAIARADKALRLQGIFVLVDPTHFGVQLNNPLLSDTLRAQVGAADLLLITKTDIASDAEIRETTDLLKRESPGILAVEASTADVPVSLLFDFEGEGVPSKENDHDPHGIFWTGSVVGDRLCDLQKLKNTLADCRGLLRCKGIVRSDNEGWSLVQWVAGRMDVSPIDEPNGEVLVYIGVDAKPEGFERSLQHCFE